MLDLTFDCAGDAAASALAQLRHSRSLTHLEIPQRGTGMSTGKPTAASFEFAFCSN